MMLHWYLLQGDLQSSKGYSGNETKIEPTQHSCNDEERLIWCFLVNISPNSDSWYFFALIQVIKLMEVDHCQRLRNQATRPKPAVRNQAGPQVTQSLVCHDPKILVLSHAAWGWGGPSTKLRKELFTANFLPEQGRHAEHFIPWMHSTRALDDAPSNNW